MHGSEDVSGGDDRREAGPPLRARCPLMPQVSCCPPEHAPWHLDLWSPFPALHCACAPCWWFDCEWTNGFREEQVHVDLLSQGDMLTAIGEGEGVPGGPREMSLRRSPRGTWSSSPMYELHLERADAVDKHFSCEYRMSAPPPRALRRIDPHRAPRCQSWNNAAPWWGAAVTVGGRGLTLNRGGSRGATLLVAARASRRYPLHCSSSERKSSPQFASAALL